MAMRTHRVRYGKAAHHVVVAHDGLRHRPLDGAPHAAHLSHVTHAVPVLLLVMVELLLLLRRLLRRLLLQPRDAAVHVRAHRLRERSRAHEPIKALFACITASQSWADINGHPSSVSTTYSLKLAEQQSTGQLCGSISALRGDAPIGNWSPKWTVTTAAGC